jgi:scyllo-inositol 2-dehydrogenase (NADP+)
VGLIGFGLAGQAFHAPVIRGVSGMELACILERHGSNAQRKYPEVRVARTLDEMLSDQTIVLVVVATPNDSHFSYTRASLEAGRDVVVDKPFTPTLAEAEALVRLAAERGRIVTVYQDRRWDGEFATVKHLIKSGALGSVAEYEARFDRFRLESKPGAWREKPDHPAAGVLWDLGPHLIDQALVLFGAPESICATAFCQRPTSQIDDAFDVVMEYPQMRARLCARIIAVAPGPHLLIHGTDGNVYQVWDGSAGRDSSRPELSRRIGLGRKLGRGIGRSMGHIEPCEWRGSQSQDRTRRLSRFLRRRAGRD